MWPPPLMENFGAAAAAGEQTPPHYHALYLSYIKPPTVDPTQTFFYWFGYPSNCSPIAVEFARTATDLNNICITTQEQLLTNRAINQAAHVIKRVPEWL